MCDVARYELPDWKWKVPDAFSIFWQPQFAVSPSPDSRHVALPQYAYYRARRETAANDQCSAPRTQVTKHQSPPPAAPPSRRACGRRARERVSTCARPIDRRSRADKRTRTDM